MSEFKTVLLPGIAQLNGPLVDMSAAEHTGQTDTQSVNDPHERCLDAVLGPKARSGVEDDSVEEVATACTEVTSKWSKTETVE